MPEYPWIIYRMSEGPLTTKEVHQGVNEQLNRKLGTDWGYSEYEWANLLQGFRPLPIRTASGTIAHFSDGADDVPMKSVVANIVPIQSGSGTPSPSNPRPISGTNELTLTKTGNNLNGFTLSDFQGGIVVGNARFIGIKIPKSTITYSSNAPTGYIWVARDFTDITTANNRVFSGSPVTYDNVEWLCIGLQKDNMETAFEYLTQAELGNTATDFAPYTGSTYNIALGRTVYGGMADVVEGSGTSDLKYLEIDGTEASLALDSAPNVVRLTLSDLPSSNVSSQDYCYWGSESNYKYSATSNLSNNEATMRTNGYLYYKNASCTTLSDFQTFFANQKANGTPFAVCYELATPTEYTFTGQPINSYLGVNNLWTDSGEVLDVEYRSNF